MVIRKIFAAVSLTWPHIFPTSASAQLAHTNCPSASISSQFALSFERLALTLVTHLVPSISLLTPLPLPAAPAAADRAQLVEFWDALLLGDKRALVNIRAEPGGESVCRNMEIRLLQRPAPAQQALSTEQRNMVTAGRTLFEVLVRGKGLESLSGEALAT